MEDHPTHLYYERLCDHISRLSLNKLKFANDRQESGDNNLHRAIFRDDIDSLGVEVNKINVNDTNITGETPLHIAAKSKSRHGPYIIKILIEKGSDVNARNKWHQTPLHYAAIAESVDNIEALMKIPNIDVNAKDVNGYNALQSLIGSSRGTDPEDMPFSSNLKKAIRILVNRGTDINSQTEYGHSILHLSTMRKDNTALLKFLISDVAKHIDMSLKDKLGENFLHLYVTSEITKDILEMFDTISNKDSIILKELLSEPNVFRRTPWEVMIDDSNVNIEGIKKIFKFGISAKGSDILGNSVLHRIAGVSNSWYYVDCLEILISAGADVNARNIFNETAVFVLFMEMVFDVFLKYNINCNETDRWGRSPFISIMKHRPIPDLLKAIIEKGKANVNEKDAFNSTPLHFAAYHNFEEQVELLLSHGADKHAKDNLEETPLDTARRHSSYRCHEMLQTNQTNILYVRRKDFLDILLELPRKIKSSNINDPHEVQRILRMPNDLDSFMDSLMETYCNRSFEKSDEVEEVVMEIKRLVQTLCIQIGKCDCRFETSVFPTGSSAEGTKVGRPDEFDFVLCFDKLIDITDIVMTKTCRKTGFACLKFKDNPVSDKYLPFSDMEGYFVALPFLQNFWQYLRRALYEPSLWKKGKLYYTYEDKMVVINGKPVFNFKVYWVGSVYKQLKISVDLVPAVYKKGWWPPNVNINNIPLMNESIRSKGCLLILQTKTNEFGKTWRNMKYSISQTCNNDREEQSYITQRMLRVSAAPAEICLIKSMPPNFRNAYTLAKIVKSKEVTPEIEVDRFPEEIRKSFALPLKPSQQIKSYMLKNCTFYLLQEMMEAGKMAENPSTLQLTSKIYEHLLYYADEQHLSPYFLPYSDAFEFEKGKEKLSTDNFIRRYKRELSIKLVLGILNHPFPKKYMVLTPYEKYF